jgi:hypothetical protein
VRHFLCLPFGKGIPISIQSGIDLTGRCKAVRNDLFIQLHRYTHLIAIPICFQQRPDQLFRGQWPFVFLIKFRQLIQQAIGLTGEPGPRPGGV